MLICLRGIISKLVCVHLVFLPVPSSSPVLLILLLISDRAPCPYSNHILCVEHRTSSSQIKSLLSSGIVTDTEIGMELSPNQGLDGALKVKQGLFAPILNLGGYGKNAFCGPRGDSA